MKTIRILRNVLNYWTNFSTELTGCSLTKFKENPDDIDNDDYDNTDHSDYEYWLKPSKEKKTWKYLIIKVVYNVEIIIATMKLLTIKKILLVEFVMNLFSFGILPLIDCERKLL